MNVPSCKALVRPAPSAAQLGTGLVLSATSTFPSPAKPLRYAMLAPTKWCQALVVRCFNSWMGARMISTWLPSWSRKRKPVRWDQPISDNLAANTPQGPGSSADQASKLPNQVCWLQYPNWQIGGTAQEHPTEYNILGPTKCWWSVRTGAVSLPLSSQAWKLCIAPARSSWINDSDRKTALAAWKSLGQATETRTLCLCASSALLCAKRGHSWANAWHFFFTVPLVW